MAWPNTVRKDDLRIEFYRGSGPGGQHRNKTSSACRITHKITGISAQCEDERCQHKNKKIAFRRLAAKLVPLMKKEVEGAVAKIILHIQAHAVFLMKYSLNRGMLRQWGHKFTITDFVECN